MYYYWGLVLRKDIGRTLGNDLYQLFNPLVW